MSALAPNRRAPLARTQKAARVAGELDPAADNSRWGTPRYIYDWLDAAFAFTVDVCADEGNYKHPRYFDEFKNGLRQSWAGETFFCNPPYGDGIGNWFDKGKEECIYDNAAGVYLVPARVDTKWWKRGVLQKDGEAGKLRSSRYVQETDVLWLRFERLLVGIYHHDQRIWFEGAKDDSAPFPSSLIILAGVERRPIRPRPFEADREYPVLTMGWPR